ncbi:MAG: T9SS type A sorting domain-containing protein, partial [Bacteroidota bacterium]
AAAEQFSGEPGGITYAVNDGVLNIIGDGASGRFQVFSYALHDGDGAPRLANVIGSSDLLYLRARTQSGEAANLRVDLVDESNFHTTNASRTAVISGTDYDIYSLNYAGGYQDGGYGGTGCTDDIEPCTVNGTRITAISFYPEPTEGAFNDTIQIDWLSFGEALMVSTDDFAEVESLRLFPNPATGEFGVAYRLARPAELTVQLYNGIGRPVRNLALGRQAAGEGFTRVDVSTLPAGLYFFRMTVNGRVSRARALRVR